MLHVLKFSQECIARKPDDSCFRKCLSPFLYRRRKLACFQIDGNLQIKSERLNSFVKDLTRQLPAILINFGDIPSGSWALFISSDRVWSSTSGTCEVLVKYASGCYTISSLQYIFSKVMSGFVISWDLEGVAQFQHQGSGYWSWIDKDNAIYLVQFVYC